MAFCLQRKHSDFRGYPFRTYETTRTDSFQRDNCPSGSTGSIVPYSKTYTSNISQQDADSKANADNANFQIEGINNARANGTCSTVPDPAPPATNVNGYLKSGYMEAYNENVWIVDTAKHMIVRYSDFKLSSLLKSPLELKNGVCDIGIENSPGTGTYQLSSPTRLSIGGTTSGGRKLAVIHNNRQHIKIFDVYIGIARDKLAGTTIFTHTGPIYNVAVGWDANGIADKVYFVIDNPDTAGPAMSKIICFVPINNTNLTNYTLAGNMPDAFTNGEVNNPTIQGQYVNGSINFYSRDFESPDLPYNPILLCTSEWYVKELSNQHGSAMSKFHIATSSESRIASRLNNTMETICYATSTGNSYGFGMSPFGWTAIEWLYLERTIILSKNLAGDTKATIPSANKRPDHVCYDKIRNVLYFINLRKREMHKVTDINEPSIYVTDNITIS